MLVNLPASAKTSKPVKQPVLSKRVQNHRGLGLLIVLSVILHGGLLLLPMPQWWLRIATPEPELDEELEQSGAIALTTLPVVVKPAPIVPVAPEPAPEPTIIESPPLNPTILTQVPDNFLEDSQEEVVEELDEVPEQEIEDVPAPPPEDLDDNKLDAENNEPEAGIAIPFNDDFTHVDGAQAGCYGLNNCLTVDGKNSDDVIDVLTPTLASQGYRLERYEDPTVDLDRSHKIYEMHSLNAPDADIKYLNIFVESIKTIIYVITPELIEREDLENLSLG